MPDSAGDDATKPTVPGTRPDQPTVISDLSGQERTVITDLSGAMTQVGPPPSPPTAHTALTVAPGADIQDAIPTHLSDPDRKNPSGTDLTDLHVGTGQPHASAGTHLGEVWGDFQFIRLLGRGGMGAVYLGKQISLDRQVAIKVLPAQVSRDEVFRARFQREARAIAAISSPHVVQVISAGSHAGHEFFVMELVQGTDLARKLRSGWRATRDEALDVALQIARGLSAAARLGIVHRDIKPANVLIGTDGVLKLSDFGLARTVGDQQELTVAGTIMGTVSYLSPEQARSVECDQRSDLYSLGVVLFEMLAGRVPFVASDAGGIIYQHIHEAVPDLRRFAPGIDPGCIAVVARLLAKNPAQRHQTADELIADLEALRRGERPAQAGWRQPRWWAVAGAALVLLAVGASYGVGRERRAEVPPAPAVPQPPVAAPVAAPAVPAPPDDGIRTDAHGRYVEFAVAGVGFRLRECPAGSFIMGSQLDEDGRSRDEVPHQVRFTRFWMSDCEVTQAQWVALMGSNPSRFPAADRPVESVSRTDAQEFLRRLGEAAKGFRPRLPTEPEWEYACRAGSITPFSGGRPLPVQGWYAGNSGKETHQVRQFLANAWGFHDLHGNVAEWTADGLESYQTAVVTDPEPVSGGHPVIRGGSFADDPEDCRAARRDYAKKASERIGFRFVCREPPKPAK